MSRQDDSNDESIDGDGLAEDDGDQVLGLDPGGLDAAAHDAGAGGVDAEGGANHGQGHGQTHPDAENRVLVDIDQSEDIITWPTCRARSRSGTSRCQASHRGR